MWTPLTFLFLSGTRKGLPLSYSVPSKVWAGKVEEKDTHHFNIFRLLVLEDPGGADGCQDKSENDAGQPQVGQEPTGNITLR
jgi:hypothetical protein